MEEQRLEVIQSHEEGLSISELAEIHGVSRKTIYKWLEDTNKWVWLDWPILAGGHIIRPTK